jgi:hypothetical protein
VLLLAAGAVWQWWPRPAAEGPRAEDDDPRLTYATPYRNVRPGVKYVGDRVCARCHADLAESFRQHPMGRSLAPVADARAIERYDPTAKPRKTGGR